LQKPEDSRLALSLPDSNRFGGCEQKIINASFSKQEVDLFLRWIEVRENDYPALPNAPGFPQPDTYT
jgi:hypothetical protein